MSSSALIKSSLAKKYWMGATGLFLCIFIVGHLAGNLQLLMDNTNDAAKLQFNAYAKFMTTNIAIKVMSWITYISIILHAIDGLMLTLKNRAARPVNYVYSRPDKNSIWSSRNMGILGSIIFIFLVLHMRVFWAEMHWGDIGVDANGNRNLWDVVINYYNDPELGLVFCILYAVAMVAVSLHLVHGFQSGFQSLGLYHSAYTPLIKKAGIVFSVVVPAAFAWIPFHIYLTY